MADLWSLSLLALLGGWVLLTLIFQFDRFAGVVSIYDVFRLVPRWTFFSPNPGHHDLHLVIRDKLPSGELTPWNEVCLNYAGTAVPFVWNPGKRIAKVLWDSWASIQYLGNKENVPASRLPMSGAYMMLLGLANRTPVSHPQALRQFAIVRSTGFSDRTPEPLFVSLFHVVEERKSLFSDAKLSAAAQPLTG